MRLCQAWDETDHTDDEENYTVYASKRFDMHGGSCHIRPIANSRHQKRRACVNVPEMERRVTGNGQTRQ
jgi:hypothetical protein